MKNRDGNLVKIEKRYNVYDFYTLDKDGNPIEWGWGFSEDGNGNIASVDPSGGPYVCIGMNLREIDKSLPDEIIIKIKSKKSGVRLYAK